MSTNTQNEQATYDPEENLGPNPECTWFNHGASWVVMFILALSIAGNVYQFLF